MALEKLFLIDAHALCYSSFYAIRELTNSRGQPTNAVYGFIATLKKILREYQPDYLAVCFDSKGKTNRQEKFSDYKIQRPPMPDGLISQISIIKDVMDAYGFKVFEVPGLEADDLIATLATKASATKKIEVVIVSEDKDMVQLASDCVRFYSFRKDFVYGSKEIQEKYGFEPIQIIDYISLAGDSSDNIPGVVGVGEVTAKNLIKEFGGLDEILKNIDSIKSEKLKEKLTLQKDKALLSRELAILEKNAPIEFSLDQLKIRPASNNRLLELFKDLEFKKFSEELSGPQGMAVKENLDVIKIDDKKSIQVLIVAINKSKNFSFLFEQESESLEAGLFVIALDGKAYQIKSEQLDQFSGVFGDASILKVTFNLKSVLGLLAENKCIPQNVYDVMLASFLSGTLTRVAGVNDLVWAYCRESLGEKATVSTQALYLEKIYQVLIKDLKEKNLSSLLNEIEMPLAYVLFKMESNGVNLDLSLLKKLSGQADEKISELTKKLYQMAGEEFNLNSPKQLSRILFEVLKLPVVKKTKTGLSTDEEVLSILAQKHEVATYILEYRQIAKLKSTYIDALPEMINSKTGRIHAEFDQIGAETGRLSSRNPNLQNIPIRTEFGRQIRKAFIPSEKGMTLLSVDYSQIELRILAHLSKDKNLMKAFEADEDIHKYTASLIFDVKDGAIDYQMRDTAKRINFGIVYGMSAFGLSKDLGIRPDEAQDFIDRYFLRYPGVKAFMDKTIVECEKNGFVVTLLNRRRYIPEINNKNNSIKQFAARQAINTPVQGSAADLMKLAMIKVDQALVKNKLSTRMLITVHDELVLEANNKEVGQTAKIVKDEMEQAFKLDVPIKVTVKSGNDWLDMIEISSGSKK